VNTVFGGIGTDDAHDTQARVGEANLYMTPAEPMVARTGVVARRTH